MGRNRLGWMGECGALTMHGCTLERKTFPLTHLGSIVSKADGTIYKFDSSPTWNLTAPSSFRLVKLRCKQTEKWNRWEGTLPESLNQIFKQQTCRLHITPSSPIPAGITSPAYRCKKNANVFCVVCLFSLTWFSLLSNFNWSLIRLYLALSSFRNARSFFNSGDQNVLILCIELPNFWLVNSSSRFKLPNSRDKSVCWCCKSPK